MMGSLSLHISGLACDRGWCLLVYIIESGQYTQETEDWLHHSFPWRLARPAPAAFEVPEQAELALNTQYWT
jgi:hypothetical protein